MREQLLQDLGCECKNILTTILSARQAVCFATSPVFCYKLHCINTDFKIFITQQISLAFARCIVQKKFLLSVGLIKILLALAREISCLLNFALAFACRSTRGIRGTTRRCVLCVLYQSINLLANCAKQ